MFARGHGGLEVDGPERGGVVQMTTSTPLSMTFW